MTPQQAIASLDRALADNGAPCTLRRMVDGEPVEVAVQAHLRRFDAQDMGAGAVTQSLIMAILSPTPLSAAEWPGDAQDGFVGDWRAPRIGDELTHPDGHGIAIKVAPIRMAGVLVRIELILEG